MTTARRATLRHNPAAAGPRILGLVVLLAATVLTIWARLALGAMWSAAPTVKEEHRLRTSGPYRITRHPIYTGLISAGIDPNSPQLNAALTKCGF